jgi:hypothetical protein
MAQKPKKAPKPKADEEQSERFIKAAREIGADESGKEFEQLFEKVIPPRRPKR